MLVHMFAKLVAPFKPTYSWRLLVLLLGFRDRVEKHDPFTQD